MLVRSTSTHQLLKPRVRLIIYIGVGSLTKPWSCSPESSTMLLPKKLKLSNRGSNLTPQSSYLASLTEDLVMIIDCKRNLTWMDYAPLSLSQMSYCKKKGLCSHPMKIKRIRLIKGEAHESISFLTSIQVIPMITLTGKLCCKRAMKALL